MRNVMVKVSSLVLLAGIWLCFGMLACNDDPVGPEPPQEFEDYAVYFYDAIHNDGNWYFEYHPLTNEIDSVYLPLQHGPVVSADGKTLYLKNEARGTLAIVETESFTVTDELPYSAPIAASPDNQLIAVFREGLYILSTSDYSVVFHDSSLGGGVFSSYGQSFYGTSGWETGPPLPFAFKVDLSAEPISVSKKNFAGGSPLQVVPSPDESKWFLYLQVEMDVHIFAVYDVVTDSIVFRDELIPGYGELEITPDGKYVFYTNPGPGLRDPGPPWVTVFDVEANRIQQRISTSDFLPEPYQNGVPIGQLAVTPDGRWLVVMSARSFAFLFTVNIRTMSISNHINVGHFSLQGLACQNGP